MVCGDRELARPRERPELSGSRRAGRRLEPGAGPLGNAPATDATDGATVSNASATPHATYTTAATDATYAGRWVVTAFIRGLAGRLTPQPPSCGPVVAQTSLTRRYRVRDVD